MRPEAQPATFRTCPKFLICSYGRVGTGLI